MVHSDPRDEFDEEQALADFLAEEERKQKEAYLRELQELDGRIWVDYLWSNKERLLNENIKRNEVEDIAAFVELEKRIEGYLRELQELDGRIWVDYSMEQQRKTLK